MTIFQHTLRQLLNGQKTETSRLALPEPDGTKCAGTEMIAYPNGIMSVQRGATDDSHWITRWQVGKDYAIQPARTVKSIGRFRVDHIWKQDVRTLTDEQVQAEGFKDGLDITGMQAFLRVWTEMHDVIAYARMGHKPKDQWQNFLDGRDYRLYIAWRLKITVLWDTIDWEVPAVKILHIVKKDMQ